MSVASAHASVLMYTSYLNDLNYNLMMVSMKRQAVVAQESAIIAEYATKQANQSISNSTSQAAIITNALNNPSGDISVALDALNALTQSSSLNWSEDPNYLVLHLQETNLDSQQKKLETQIKAVTANLESQQKLLDNNIKEDFGPKLSI